jgi:transposase
VRQLIAADPVLARNLALLRSITGFDEISATVLLAELPNIAEFTPRALAAFTGLSPQEHSSGPSVHGANDSLGAGFPGQEADCHGP